MTAPSLRIDRLLWFLRFIGSRSAAQCWVMAGHIRLNGQRVSKTSQPVHAGDVLTLPLGQGVHVVEILTLPVRRGPAPEARACYRFHGEGNESDSQQGEVIDADAPAALGGSQV